MLSYLARQTVAAFPIAFPVGIAVAVVLAVSGRRGAAMALGVVLVLGLFEYVAAKLWLRTVEERDAKEWLSHNPDFDPDR